MNNGYPYLFVFGTVACLLSVESLASELSVHTLTTPLFTFAVITCLLGMLPQRLSVTFQILIGELVLLVCLLDTYCQVYFCSPISPSIMQMCLHSNARETFEFMKTFVGWYVLLNWKISVLLLLCVIFPLSFYKSTGRISNRCQLLVIALLFAIEIAPTAKYLSLFSSSNNSQSIERLIFCKYHSALPTPLHRLVYAVYVNNLSKQVLNDIKQATFSAKVNRCSYKSRHIVLVIGESYNKHHSTLYGYEHKTTPRQQKRYDEHELVVFDDVVSPWNITSNVFIGMFSMGNYNEVPNVDKSPLFPVYFRKAGYDVNFFSNQYVLRGLDKGTTNQSGSFFLSDYQLCNTLFSHRNESDYYYDIGIVNEVEEFMKATDWSSKPTLDIIHLLGQHFDYSLRYPKENAAFGQPHTSQCNLDTKAQETVMHYDNAIEYDDYVLDSILNMYQNEDAIVVFVADHGEEVYDDMKTVGRTFNDITQDIAQNEYEVPMWIWMSNKYKEAHPSIVSKVEGAIHRPFLTEDMPHLLLYLAGIDCDEYRDTYNLISDGYSIRKRILAGIYKYRKRY